MNHSIRLRFAFTVSSNVFRALLSFATGLLVARWLGPETYGSMAFLLGTFVAVRQVLDMGSAAAFFTFLSQTSRSRRFVLVYFIWLVLQMLLVTAIVGLLMPSRWIAAIWHGEDRVIVVLAFCASFLQGSIWLVVQQAAESQRRTLWVQGIGVVIAAVHLLAIVALWRFGLLGLHAIFIAIALEYLIASLVAQRGSIFEPSTEQIRREDALMPMLRKYFRYCWPMLPYCCVSFFYEFADRWLLQKYGGSVEQAYYALGAQFAAVALIATTSILKIFWKEIAEAHHRLDYARTAALYRKVSRLLFLTGATIAGYLAPWSEALLRVFLGAEYAGGAAALAIMFLYPVHQSLGQINGTMLYATERVGVQVKIGIAFMAASIGITYLVLAPPDALVPGFGLASEGLALKMVVTQFIAVNITAYVLSRIMSRPFDWLYQPAGLLGCLALGWLAHAAASSFSRHWISLAVDMGVAALIYLVLVAGFVYLLPWLADTTRKELVRDVNRAWHGAARIASGR